MASTVAVETLAFKIAPPWWAHDSDYIAPLSIRFQETVNRGVSVSWRMNASALQGFLPAANSFGAYTEEQLWYVVVQRAENDAPPVTSDYLVNYSWSTYISPPLVVGKFTLVEGNEGVYLDCIAVDLFSFRSTTSGITMPTLKDHYVIGALQAVTQQARWTGSGNVTDTPAIVVPSLVSNTRIHEVEVQGDALGSYISRIARDFALDMRWTWNRLATAPGSTLPSQMQVVFMDPSVSTAYDATTASGIWTDSLKYHYDLSRRYHRIYLQKASKTPGIFEYPIDKFGYFTTDVAGGLVAATIQLKDLSQVGTIGYVAGYAGAGHTGVNTYLALTGQYSSASLGLTPIAGGNVYSITGSLDPPTSPSSPLSQANGYLVLTGTPVQTEFNYDGNFELVYPPIGSTPPQNLARERRLILTSPFWDTKNSTNLNYIQYLYRNANKNVFTIERKVRFNPLIPAGYWYQHVSYVGPVLDTFPSARYDSISWSWSSGGAPEMTMHGWIPVL